MHFPFLLFVLFLSGCEQAPPEKKKLAQAIYAQAETYVEKAVFYGTVQASKSSALTVQSEGAVEWKSQPGDAVDKDSIIAQIANPEITKAYELATNAAAIAKQQYTRSAALAKSNTTSQQQLQEREQLWITAQQNLTKAEIDLKKSQFIAPFAGIVGPQLIHAGTQVKIGDVIGHFFAPLDQIVEVLVPLAFKEHLKAKQTAIIAGKKYPLPHVPKMLNPDSNMLVIHIPIENEALLVGEVVDVEIHLQEWPQVIVLPLGAIKFEDQAATVLICNAAGKLETRQVSIGLKDAKQAVVVKGIKPGEIICRDPHHYYEEESIIPQFPEL